MAKQIKIYGEVIPFEGYSDCVCCADVDRQLEAAGGEDVDVDINSVGGDVAEGFMIYTSLRKYATKHNAKVTTYIKGRCYSIATVIFLAGDVRIANKFLSPFIHNAWIYSVGDARQLQRDADDLENVNKKIATFYAEHTELTYEEARAWMDADTFIEPEECVSIRFATEIEEIVRPAALRRTLNKNNNSTMSKKNNNWVAKAMAFLSSHAADGANNLEVFTSTNDSVIFPDLEDGEEPKIGDKAEVDGKAAEGEYTMADGRTFVFVAGVLEEIREEDEEETEDTQTMEELQAENARLREQLESQNSAKDQEIADLKAKYAKAKTDLSTLKNLMSEYVADTPSNSVRTKGKEVDENDKNPLASSIAKLKESGKK